MALNRSENAVACTSAAPAASSSFYTALRILPSEQRAAMTNENNGPALLDIALPLAVHLGNERTGSVEYGKTPTPGFVFDDAGDAMRAEDRNGSLRNLGQALHEARSLASQVVNYVPVVDNFMPLTITTSAHCQSPSVAL